MGVSQRALPPFPEASTAECDAQLQQLKAEDEAVKLDWDRSQETTVEWIGRLTKFYENDKPAWVAIMPKMVADYGGENVFYLAEKKCWSSSAEEAEEAGETKKTEKMKNTKNAE